ncbi:RNA-binding protein, putative [Plasmodium reichenowi]|uniref:RNA-binding protein, putative n=1 Tax=Plasmodium reichenowi TaxID=5854 RepID=A0A151LCB9_PLARE|nr:RNA-binding protein, putative [Plasmodium reichenowi]KYN96603.1 RNA-binding protein, putative [Plasmodium reichenowi]
MVDSGCSILIRNLNYDTSPDKVRKIFENVGKVKDVYLPLDHYTRKPRGFGFVEYFESKYAKEAINILNHSRIDGNEIRIIIAQNRRKSPDTMKFYHNEYLYNYRQKDNRKYNNCKNNKRKYSKYYRADELDRSRYKRRSTSSSLHKYKKRKKKKNYSKYSTSTGSHSFTPLSTYSSTTSSIYKRSDDSEYYTKRRRKKKQKKTIKEKRIKKKRSITYTNSYSSHREDKKEQHENKQENYNKHVNTNKHRDQNYEKDDIIDKQNISHKQVKNKDHEDNKKKREKPYNSPDIHSDNSTSQRSSNKYINNKLESMENKTKRSKNFKNNNKKDNRNSNNSNNSNKCHSYSNNSNKCNSNSYSNNNNNNDESNRKSLSCDTCSVQNVSIRKNEENTKYTHSHDIMTPKSKCTDNQKEEVEKKCRDIYKDVENTHEGLINSNMYNNLNKNIYSKNMFEDQTCKANFDDIITDTKEKITEYNHKHNINYNNKLTDDEHIKEKKNALIEKSVQSYDNDEISNESQKNAENVFFVKAQNVKNNKKKNNLENLIEDKKSDYIYNELIDIDSKKENYNSPSLTSSYTSKSISLSKSSSHSISNNRNEKNKIHRDYVHSYHMKKQKKRIKENSTRSKSHSENVYYSSDDSQSEKRNISVDVFRSNPKENKEKNKTFKYKDKNKTNIISSSYRRSKSSSMKDSRIFKSYIHDTNDNAGFKEFKKKVGRDKTKEKNIKDKRNDKDKNSSYGSPYYSPRDMLSHNSFEKNNLIQKKNEDNISQGKSPYQSSKASYYINKERSIYKHSNEKYSKRQKNKSRRTPSKYSNTSSYDNKKINKHNYNKKKKKKKYYYSRNNELSRNSYTSSTYSKKRRVSTDTSTNTKDSYSSSSYTNKKKNKNKYYSKQYYGQHKYKGYRKEAKHSNSRYE